MVADEDGVFARLRSGVRDDLGSLGARLYALRPRRGVSLRHRRFEGAEGRVRLHLRTHEDGTGLLIVNGTEALHLSPLQAECARLVFDGINGEGQEACPAGQEDGERRGVESALKHRALIHLRTRFGATRSRSAASRVISGRGSGRFRFRRGESAA